MANNCKQCFNTHYEPHCHPTTKSVWLCSSVYCGPPHPSRRIMVGGRSRQPKRPVWKRRFHAITSSYRTDQWVITQISKFMGPIWSPPGSCRPLMGPMLAPWTLLSGYRIRKHRSATCPHMPLLPTWVNFVPSMEKNYIQYKMWDEITYPFPSFNRATVEVWGWISNFIPHFT